METRTEGNLGLSVGADMRGHRSFRPGLGLMRTVCAGRCANSHKGHERFATDVSLVKFSSYWDAEECLSVMPDR